MKGVNGKVPEYTDRLPEYLETAIDLAGECAKSRTCVSLSPDDKLEIIIYLTENEGGATKSEIIEKFLCENCKTYEVDLFDNEDSVSTKKYEMGSYNKSKIKEGDLDSYCNTNIYADDLDSCIESEDKKCLLGYFLNKFSGHLCDNDLLIQDGKVIKLNYEVFGSKGDTYLNVLRDKCIKKLGKLARASSS
jgi:hypothetical protein